MHMLMLYLVYISVSNVAKKWLGTWFLYQGKWSYQISVLYFKAQYYLELKTKGKCGSIMSAVSLQTIASLKSMAKGLFASVCLSVI